MNWENDKNTSAKGADCEQGVNVVSFIIRLPGVLVRHWEDRSSHREEI